MTINDFLNVIYAHRDMLGEPETRSYKAEADNNYFYDPPCHGCPLRVVMRVSCSLYSKWHDLFDTKGVPVNPDPCAAADRLLMHEMFTVGVAIGWDEGLFYNDREDPEYWELEFAGFLIGFTLRPAPLLLAEAA